MTTEELNNELERGMLAPLTEEDQAAWRREFNTEPPSVAYRGPSYDELVKRDPNSLNDAERYWIATIRGDKLTVDQILSQQQIRDKDEIIANRDLLIRLQQERIKLGDKQAKGLFGDLADSVKIVTYAALGYFGFQALRRK